MKTNAEKLAENVKNILEKLSKEVEEKQNNLNDITDGYKALTSIITLRECLSPIDKNEEKSMVYILRLMQNLPEDKLRTSLYAMFCEWEFEENNRLNDLMKSLNYLYEGATDECKKNDTKQA